MSEGFTSVSRQALGTAQARRLSGMFRHLLTRNVPCPDRQHLDALHCRCTRLPWWGHAPVVVRSPPRCFGPVGGDHFPVVFLCTYYIESRMGCHHCPVTAPSALAVWCRSVCVLVALLSGYCIQKVPLELWGYNHRSSACVSC